MEPDPSRCPANVSLRLPVARQAAAAVRPLQDPWRLCGDSDRCAPIHRCARSTSSSATSTTTPSIQWSSRNWSSERRDGRRASSLSRYRSERGRTPSDRRTFIESISAVSDSDLFTFLAEEVLDQQDERTRDFLQTTSIVRQITPELAERLAGVADGDEMLSSLEKRGLFTYCIDNQRRRYRYHGLFRDFLERHLIAKRAPGEIIGLHIHAASYFETHQEWPEAIHHYLRADLQRQAGPANYAIRRRRFGGRPPSARR